jgi:predicted O-methyltransferase YrrM
MAATFQPADYGVYKMVYHEPHKAFEPMEREIAVVDAALQMLIDQGILPHKKYDETRFLAFRKAVAESFEIPWTAITPRMQRLIWAINAIHQPKVMIAAGIFCGNTFISNAGAAIGPGAAYTGAQELIGIEIKPAEADRARRNVEKLDGKGICKILAEDAVMTAANYPGKIDLLYLDADGDAKRGKGIYYDIVQSAWDKLPKGALILAHNSGNAAPKLEHYLAFVRDSKNCAASVNCLLDIEGLEVTKK